VAPRRPRHRTASVRLPINDPELAFGDGDHLGRFEQPGRRQDKERVRELVDDARYAITERLARELDQGLGISGVEEDPGSAIGA
jgi:hypothetical protein